jgi:hypothetical protein
MTYLIAQIETGWRGPFESTDLEWTTEPPTQEGWYWAKDKSFNDPPSVVYVSIREGIEYVTSADWKEAKSFERFRAWMGPLPVP